MMDDTVIENNTNSENRSSVNSNFGNGGFGGGFGPSNRSSNGDFSGGFHSSPSTNGTHDGSHSVEHDINSSRSLASNNSNNRTNGGAPSNVEHHQQHHEGDGFTKVTHRRKPPVFGTKPASASSAGLVGERSQREFSLFVGGLRKDLNCNELEQYIQNELQITPKSVEINKTNPYNRSFRVIVQHKDKDTMFTPANWQENIIIKPFRIRREHPL